MVISLPESTRLDVYVECNVCDVLVPERAINKHLYIHSSRNAINGRLSVYACVNITTKVPIVTSESHELHTKRKLPKTVIVNFNAPKTLSSTLFDNNDYETESATTSSSSQVPDSNSSLSSSLLKRKSKWAQYLSRQIPKKSKRNGKQRQIDTTRVDETSDFGQESIRRKERYDTFLVTGLLPPETEPVWPEPEPIDFERTDTTDEDRVEQKPEIVTGGDPLSDLSSVKIEATKSDDVHLQTLHIPPTESPVSSPVQIKTEPTTDVTDKPISSLSPEQQEIDSILRPRSVGDSSSLGLCSAAIQMTNDGENETDMEKRNC